MQNKPEDLKTDGDCCCYNIIESSKKHLDIKVLDDPHKVSDIKQKVLDFLKIPGTPKAALRIVGVDYAIICTASDTSTQSGVATKR